MIYEEFKQLSAYARYDGFYLSIIWVGSFACLLGMPLLPLLSQFSFTLCLSTPFFVAYRLRLFRDEGRNGSISYKRALFYCFRVFFNAAIIFSLLQWLYMEYLDKGGLLTMVTNMYAGEEGKTLIESLGMPYNDFMSLLPNALSPYSLASSSFVTAMVVGSLLSFIIAAIMAKKRI